MAPLPKWGSAATDLHWRHWDGAFVVYHEASGNTHTFNPTGAAVLRLLAAEALREDELLSRLRNDAAAVDPEDLPATLPALLEHLRLLGLIDTVTCDDDAADA